ncbi:MAG: hypothetical protein D3924_12085 [Candidatus Electrothrix sp. AR4]|nr:hypothetical protein [Candidatus Electrothrix sp. AR4]
MSDQSYSPKNVEELTDCCQCGTCAVICSNIVLKPSDAIMHTDFAPQVKKTTICDVCNRKRCLAVCPIHEVDKQNSAWLGPDSEIARVRQPVLASAIAHATDNDTRTKGASGGVVSALVTHLLNKEDVNGAMVVRHKKIKSHWGESVLVRNSSELFNTHSSVYTPVPFNDSLKYCVKNNAFKFAVVGRPCQLRTLGKIEKLYPQLRERIVCKIGLFCAWQLSSSALSFLASMSGKRGDKFEEVRFRHGAWPGQLVFSTRNKKNVFPFSDLRHSNGTYYYPLSIPYIPQTCSRCVDVLGTCADISVGDPWNLGLKTGLGYSMVLIRTNKGMTTWKEASEKEGLIIKDEEISQTQFLQSQGTTVELKSSGAFIRGSKCRSIKKDVLRYVKLFRLYDYLINKFKWRCFQRQCSRIFLLITWSKLRKRIDPSLYCAMRAHKEKSS